MHIAQYLNVADSVIMLKKWLKFQFARDNGRGFMYMFNILTLIDRQAKRKWVMYMVGPPDSGK